MKLHIRNAADGDMDFLVAGLEANRRIEGRAPEAVPATEEDRAFFRAGIAKGQILIAEAGDETFGFLHYADDFGVMYLRPPFWWVDLVFVAEAARGKGLGRALYAALEARARSAGIERIVIDVFDENRNSMAFHESLGFRGIYRIMEKQIP